MPRHAIVTCCDARFGDFLLRHWLVSLQANVDLSGVDVVVLDYGLDEPQRRELGERGVIVVPCERDGGVWNLRFRDICRLLDEYDYDQILSVDGGDVIFQADIRPLFDEHRDSFRAVAEDVRIPLHEMILDDAKIPAERFGHILDFLEGKAMVNAGVVFGPAAKFRDFWRFYQQTTSELGFFGMDQMLLNHFLYRDGFVALDRRFNFVLVTTASRYSVRDGVFLDEHERVIPVVHNAGNVESMRSVRNFGYRSANTRRRWWVPFRVRLLVLSGWLAKRLRGLRR